MAGQLTHPGVYIREFAPPSPIEGVGTSTAAFLGIAASGELDTPRKITSFDQFRAQFGEQPVPGFFLWYAVRGFFQNGGTVCYVVRASNGDYGKKSLEDGKGEDVIAVRARDPGKPTTPITIKIDEAHLVPGAKTALYQPEATIKSVKGRDVTLNSADEAARFRPADLVRVDSKNESVRVLRVMQDTLRFASDLVGPPVAGTKIRLADAPKGVRTIRIESTATQPPGTAKGTLSEGALMRGTILTIKQTTADSQIVESVQAEPLPTTTPSMTYRVTFREPLKIALSLDQANPATVESEEFDITVTQSVSKKYENLSVVAEHPRYFSRIVNDANDLVVAELIEPPPPTPMPDNLPKAQTVTLSGGKDEDLSGLTPSDYIEALDTLREFDDVNLVAAPDAAVFKKNADLAVVQQAVITHCEQLGDRFAVLDALRPAPDQLLFGQDSVEAQRAGLDSERGYAALYYPWLRVAPSGSGDPILVPPSGHMCGLFADSDTRVGVHKAPANQIVKGALGVERTMSNEDQGQLNIKGINVIRVFQTGGRPVLWGARTTATDTNWRYVNIRRLFLFLEESIQEGIRWAVFEPHTPSLWAKLKRSISDFLTRVWRDGALFGETPGEAFYVRIDETLNPDSVRALGRLYMEIGVRPAYPAEFIIVRIGIWHGGSEVVEQ